jgi:hypothetical protein
MSRELAVDNITTESGTTLSTAAGTNIYAPGHVLQVQQGIMRTTWSSAIGPGWADVPGLVCSIQPRSPTSRILVHLDLNYGTGYYQVKVRLLRNASVVTGALSDQEGSRTRSWLTNIMYDGTAGTTTYDMAIMSGSYLDSPGSTGIQQYSIQMGGYSTSYVVYVNRGNTFSNLQAYDGLPISVLTLYEIGT